MSFIGNAFRAVGRAIGSGIEKVGKVLNSEKIQRFGRNIQDVCAEEVSLEKSYDKTQADIYSTERMNEILVGFSEGYKSQATSIENACIKYTEDYYSEIIGALEQASGMAGIEMNLRRLRNAKSRITDKIHGSIKNPLAKRMSLDDVECLRILKMDAGDSKRRAMSAFAQKVIDDALNNLSVRIRETLDEQLEEVGDFLASTQEEQEKRTIGAKKIYDDLVKKYNQDKQTSEMALVNPGAAVEATEIVGRMLI